MRTGPRFQCPSCRTWCNQNEIKRQKFTDRRIKELKVKCPNFEITKEKALYLAKLKPISNIRDSRRKRNSKHIGNNSASRDRSRSRNRFVVSHEPFLDDMQS